MKKIILIFMLFSPFVESFGQEEPNEELRPIAIVNKCLSEAIIPGRDTVDCYPSGTKDWITLIDKYVETLKLKLDPSAKKGLTVFQENWTKEMDLLLKETNQIISDKNLPLPIRRHAAIRQFKFAEDRARYLKKIIAST